LNINKSWDVKPKSGKGRAMRVTLYACRSCGHKFRKAVKLEETPAVSEPSPMVEVATTGETAISPQSNDAPKKESFFDKLRRLF